MANIRCANCSFVPTHQTEIEDFICDNHHVICNNCILKNTNNLQPMCPLCQSIKVRNRRIVLDTRNLLDFNKINNNSSVTNFNKLEPAIHTTNSSLLEDTSDNSLGNESAFWSKNALASQSQPSSINSINFNREVMDTKDNKNTNTKYQIGDVPSDLYGYLRATGRHNESHHNYDDILSSDLFDSNMNIEQVDGNRIQEFKHGKQELKINLPRAGIENPDLDDTKLLYMRPYKGKTDPKFNAQNNFYNNQKIHYRNEQLDNYETCCNMTNISISVSESASNSVLRRFEECKEKTPAINPMTEHHVPVYRFAYNPLTLTEQDVKTLYERQRASNTSTLQSQSTDTVEQLANVNAANANVKPLPAVPWPLKVPFKKNHLKEEPSMQTIIRQKLKELTYANLKHNPDPETPCFGQAAGYTAPKNSACTESIKDSTKLPEYLGVLENFLLAEQKKNSPPQKKTREQVIQEEKDNIRNRLKNEIYSKNLNQGAEFQLMESESGQQFVFTLKGLENGGEHIPDSLKNKKLRNVPLADQTQKTISLSTESYPKLNPELNGLVDKLGNLDKNLFKLNNDAFAEIKKQFYKQSKIDSDLKSAIEINHIGKLLAGYYDPDGITIKNKLALEQDCEMGAEAHVNRHMKDVSPRKVKNIMPQMHEPKIEIWSNVPNQCSETVESCKGASRKYAANRNSTKPTDDETQKTILNFATLLREKNPAMSLEDLQEVLRNLPNIPAKTIEKAIVNVLKTFKNMPIARPYADVIGKNSYEMLGGTNYCGWRGGGQQPCAVTPNSEPLPQFQAFNLNNPGSCTAMMSANIKPAAELNIDRHPVICPVSTCKRKVFISEFTKHMKLDHVKTFIETITPGKCRNFFLDPKVVTHGVIKCHNLYLVTDKIRDLGSREYKDYLPILVMSTKITLLELICSSYKPKDRDIINSKQNFLVIWLTGLVADDLQIYYTLVVWSRAESVPKCHMVHSGKLYSFRDEQCAKSVFKSGQALLLDKDKCEMLTDNEQNMIEIQIIVH